MDFMWFFFNFLCKYCEEICFLIIFNKISHPTSFRDCGAWNNFSVKKTFSEKINETRKLLSFVFTLGHIYIYTYIEGMKGSEIC